MMKLSPFRIWRTLVPVCAFAATVFLLSKLTYPLPAYTEVLLWYSRLDPLLLLNQLRTGSMAGWIWLPLLTIAATLLLGRVFCGWFCPLGGLLALLHSLKLYGAKLLGRQNFRGAPPLWVTHLLPWRYPWLLFLLTLLAFGSSWPMLLSPFHLLTEELSLLWLQQMPWLLVGIILLGLIIFPRFWCVYLCPTGLILAWLAKWRHFAPKPPATCIHCGACEKICPTGSATPSLATTTADCLLCGRCSEICPVGNFSFSNSSSPGQEESSTGSHFTRREILRSGTALAAAGAISPLLARSADANPLRPPGALEEADFLSTCSRCGRCIKACPSKCIRSMPASSGPAMFMTPYIVAREARCELTQHCQQVCPTGAIARVPIDKVLMGLAEIDHSQCLGWAHGKLCLLCQEQCPQHAIDSDDKDRPSVRAELCVGCGACENGCPVEPAAIVVKPQRHRRR
ncbi:MAG: yccM 1 [Firmicutes bacterium]|nr:yccM 1 [Bacillota bacterium]